MHNRREYLSGKANGLGLPSREKGIFLEYAPMIRDFDRSLNDPESEVSKYIAEKGAQPYMPENGTTPSVYYV